MSDELARIARRTYQYWYEDGLAEMGTGAAFILLGLYFFGNSLLASEPVWCAVWSAGLILPVIGVFLGMRKLIGAVKNRVTYPRTGYVAYHRNSPSRRARRLRLLGLCLAIVTVAALNLAGVIPASSLVIFNAFVIGAAFLYQSLRFGLFRLGAFAALAMFLGVWAIRGRWDAQSGGAAFFLLMGITLTVSGLWHLFAYLRRTTGAGMGGNGDGR